MNILNNNNINSLLVNLLASVKDYDPFIHSMFNTMYLTGARFSDVYDFNNWQYLGNDDFTLQPKKGNNIRNFIKSDLDLYFAKSIIDNFDVSTMFSYGTAKNVFNKFIASPTLYVDNKAVNTHLFRHNKVKQLLDLGNSDVFIQNYLGQTNLSSTLSYVNSVVYSL